MTKKKSEGNSKKFTEEELKKIQEERKASLESCKAN